MTGNNPIIRLENLGMRFDNIMVLEELNLDIHNGEFITLLGPSGCGKTTLLRLIAGFESPTSGTVSIDGRIMNDVPPNQRRVNTVFQSYALFPHMSVSNNLAFGLRMAGIAKRERDQRVREALAMVDLPDMGDRMPANLSGGQQQRVAIARAVINNPKALLLDEPLSALDAKLRKRMQVQLKHLCRKLGITFVFVTHDQQEAFAMSDRVVVLDNGRIEQVGTPEEIYEEPVNLKVARFVGETCILDGSAHHWSDGILHAIVEGQPCQLKTRRSFGSHESIRVVLRPEDMVIVPEDDIASTHQPRLPGTVNETVYKGSTWDMVVDLDCGKQILITEFFNEDEDRICHKTGDRVIVSWFEGWEVVLPHEHA